jgi:hypothetical protein
MQIKVGDLVRHKYHIKYGVGLVVKTSEPYWAQVSWVRSEIGPRSQRVENLARVK